MAQAPNNRDINETTLAIDFVEITNKPGIVTQAIQKRLDLVNTEAGFPLEEAALKLDESAFAKLETLSDHNIGLALLVVRLIIQKILPLKGLPCTVTGKDIDSLDIDTPYLINWYHSPLRDVIIVEAKSEWDL